jgi:hypothetical protein
MGRMPVARRFLLSLLVLILPAQAAEISVRATRSGDVLLVEANAELDCSIDRAWRVLTDYDRLARFIPDLQAASSSNRRAKRGCCFSVTRSKSGSR